MPPRHRTPSRELQPAILGAAEDLLAEEGPAALSIRRIAARAGVAPMGLYTRFDGKHGVIDALFKEGFEALEAAILATRTIPDPLDGFRSAGLAYRDLATSHPARYRVMFLQAIPGFEPSTAAVNSASTSFLALVDAVRRCIDARVFRDGDRVEIAQDVWSACHGWIALELGGINFAADLDGGYGRLLDLLSVGLSARD